jgi:ABC-type dipeptide/oligopeptide/nickel transport system ATPase component
MRVLICGLSGAGKSYLAAELMKLLGDRAAWFDADKVRADANDWDFSPEGRARQGERMRALCTLAEAAGKISIASFIAPTDAIRVEFRPDYLIWCNTVHSSQYADTDRIFECPTDANYTVRDKCEDADARQIVWDLLPLNRQRPTAQMLGRYQPWHAGHQALLDRAIGREGQVCIMIRDMAPDESNPYRAHEVQTNLRHELAAYAGRVEIVVVPNITRISYGRKVGYVIEQEVFDAATHAISATEIRRRALTGSGDGV